MYSKSPGGIVIKISVYLPEHELQTVYLSEFTRLFCDLYGGCTVIDAFGTWKDESGYLIEEKTKIIYTFSNQTELYIQYDVKSLLREARRVMNQTVLAVELDNVLKLFAD